MSLFFSDVYNKIPEFKKMSEFGKKVRNIFGSVRHIPKAIFGELERLNAIGNK